MLVPAGTAAAIVQKLNQSLVAIIRDPQVKEQLTNAGVEPLGSTPAALAAHLERELAKWTKVVRAAGVRLD
jgi:tripartite-type tricarboxylate transporter receptor subunit TctC